MRRTGVLCAATMSGRLANRRVHADRHSSRRARRPSDTVIISGTGETVPAMTMWWSCARTLAAVALPKGTVAVPAHAPDRSVITATKDIVRRLGKRVAVDIIIITIASRTSLLESTTMDRWRTRAAMKFGPRMANTIKVAVPTPKRSLHHPPSRTQCTCII